MPGVPIFWAGRNARFAWAGVPASAPVSDVFIETLRVPNGRYQNGSLWAKLGLRSETIAWRTPLGDREETTLTIAQTRHGPLVESLWEDFAAEPTEDAREARRHRAARALAWTGALPGDGISSMLALMRVERAEQVAEALATHHEPVLAFAFADRGGEGGVQVAGWLPNRPLPTGLVPVQGRLRSFDWRERVALEDLPSARLGEDDRAWQRALDQPWPTRGGLDQTEWLWRPGDRATRLDRTLRARLDAGERLDLRDAADLLDDSGAPRAAPVVTAIVGLARLGGPLPVEAEEVASLLERWDGRLDAESAGAAAYHLVIERLIERLLREPFGDALFARYLAAPHIRPQSAIERLVLRAATLRQPGGWTDEARVTAAIRASLRETWVSLNYRLGPTRERWAWGELHRLVVSPLEQTFGAGPAMAELPSWPAKGSGQTLAYAHHPPGRSFTVDRAAFFRLAIDLGTTDRFLSVLAPGQSEHPGHPHAVDGLRRLQQGKLALFPTSRLVIEEESGARLVLEPAP